MSSYRILIVEDEAVVAMEIEERLAEMGYEPVGAAAGGERALALAEELRPDLVLMDIRLDGAMDGITAAEEIHRRFHLPVIFLTAYSDNSTLERARLAEPYGYLLKPFDDRDLRSSIEIALHKHKTDEEIRRLNRLYDVLSQTNQAVVRAQSRDELLWTVCRMMVERGSIDSAWIGFVHPETNSISPVAHFGAFGEAWKRDRPDFSYRKDDRDELAQAIEEGRPFICEPCVGRNCPHPMALPPSSSPHRSCGWFPIHFQGTLWGGLILGVNEAGFFKEREIELVREVVVDLSFALDKLEGDARRDRAEEAMRASEAKFRSYIEHAPVGVLVTDRSSRVLEVNPAATTMLGYGEAELPGLSISDILPPESLDSGLQGFQRLIQEGSAVGQLLLLRKDGTRLWASVSVVKLEGNRFLAFCQDVTEQRRAQDSLWESEERLRLFVEHAPASIAMFDGEMRYMSASRRWLEDYFLGDRDLTGLSHYEVFPEIPERWREVHRRGLAGEVVRADDDRFERADGNVQWLRWEVRPWRDSRGNVAGIVIFTEDITRRKEAEETVAARERYLRTILETTADGFWVVDGSGRFVEVNEAYCRMSGYSRSELLTMGIAHVEVSEAPVGTEGRMQRLRQRGSDFFETRHRRKDGTVFDVQVTATYLAMEGGQFVCFCRDITERIKAEEALRESERRYRMVADYNHDWEYWIGPDGKPIYVSPSCHRITGYSAEEFIEDPGLLTSVIHPEDRERIGGHFTEAGHQNGDVCQQDFRIVTRSGEVRWISHFCRSIRSEDGIRLGRRASNRDVTDRVTAMEEKEKIEAQLRQAQKIEAIGTLAGGIAHDFNNILTPIIGYTEIAMSDAPESSPLMYDLDQVLMAAKRARDLVKQILTFSRLSQAQVLRPTDISLVVKEAVKLLRASLPSTIEIRRNICRGMVVADATQIHQVIVNLCTNAAHAMNEKGVLEISLTSLNLTDKDLAELPVLRLEPGPYVKLRVADTGHGIRADIMEHIFDPYFTTKEVGEGTGLGLAVAHGIVKRHGGEILVQSTLGEGTVFEVYFPSAEVEMQRPSDLSQSLPRGTESILLVDDEPMIVEMARRILGQLGYTVTAMTDPGEALALLLSRAREIHVVITDYTMPRLTGIDLARGVLRARLGMPIILCTGFNEKVTAEMAREAGIVEIMLKPFDKRSLAEVVRRVLDARKR